MWREFLSFTSEVEGECGGEKEIGKKHKNKTPPSNQQQEDNNNCLFLTHGYLC